MLTIDTMVASVQAEHVNRAHVPRQALKPRPYQRRPRPNTVVISEALLRLPLQSGTLRRNDSTAE